MHPHTYLEEKNQHKASRRRGHQPQVPQVVTTIQQRTKSMFYTNYQTNYVNILMSSYKFINTTDAIMITYHHVSDNADAN